ncbi:sigma-70 family RNA polymerase sigma factor [Aquipseudomonas campi]
MSGSERLRNQYMDALFRGHYQWLRTRVQSRLGCAFGADDIAAETFVQVMAVPDLLDLRQPRALLTTIAQRLMYQGWRRRDLERAYLQALALEPDVEAPSTEHMAQLLEALERIDHLLERLPSKVKATFLLSMVDGMTYVEIAAHLGISLSSVKQYMTQALERCYRMGAE